MIRKPSTPRRAAGFSKRGQRGHRPRAPLARILLPLLVLAIVARWGRKLYEMMRLCGGAAQLCSKRLNVLIAVAGKVAEG
jgi:hypothetical protein